MTTAITISHPLSPLQQAGIAEPDIRQDKLRISERTDLAAARLRVLDAPHGSCSSTLDLPVRIGHCGGADPAFLCLAPGEWLVISATLTAAQLQERLQSAVDPTAAVYDFSAGISVVRLAGQGAPWLLSKLSCLDFLAGSTARQHCARTRLGDVAVILHYHQTTDAEWVFDVIADRSIAAYLWALLSKAAPHASELAHHFGATS